MDREKTTSILSLFWEAVRIVVGDVRGLRKSGLGPMLEGISQTCRDVVYYILRWPIPRDAPRSLVFVMMDVCTLGAMALGPLLYFAVLFGWSTRPPDPRVRHLVCALGPSFLFMAITAALLRGTLASRLRQGPPMVPFDVFGETVEAAGREAHYLAVKWPLPRDAPRTGLGLVNELAAYPAWLAILVYGLGCLVAGYVLGLARGTELREWLSLVYVLMCPLGVGCVINAAVLRILAVDRDRQVSSPDKPRSYPCPQRLCSK